MLDAKAKDEFYRESSERLFKIIRAARNKLPGGATQAGYETHDDVHELWIKLVEKREDHLPEGTDQLEAFYSRAYKAACNMLIDRLRKIRIRERDVQEPPLRPDGPGMITRLDVADQILKLEQASRTLTDEEMAIYFPIIVLKERQTDVFETLGLPESTGRERLRKVLLKLQQQLKPGARE